MAKATDTIGAVVALVGLGGLLLTMWTFLQKQSDRAAREDVGRACSKSSMGYFAAKTPWWFSRKVTSLPWVPTLSGLIKAGEDLAYTSALFDQIPNSHEEVSWRKIYEAFFDEMAWDHQCRRPSWGWKYLKKAKERKKAMIKFNSAAAGDTDRHLMYTPGHVEDMLVNQPSRYEEEPSLEIGLRRRKVGKGCFVLARCLRRPRLPHRGGNRQRPSLENSFRQSFMEQEVQIEKVDQMMRSNAVPTRERPSWASEVKQDQCQVWVRDAKPSIEISRAELAALQFLVGLRLEIIQDKTGRVVSLRGSGAFGISLNGELAGISDEYCRLRLTHYRYKPWQQPSKGSGYSMLSMWLAAFYHSHRMDIKLTALRSP